MSFAHVTATPGLRLNYSLYAVPVGWFIAQTPLWWAIYKANTTSPGAYNNANPKESWARLQEAGLSPQLYRRIKRSVAANDNTHTNLALFAASLAAANAAHVSTRALNICAAVWIATRIAYNVAYITIDDDKNSRFRSLLYCAGVISCLTLVVKAANKYKAVTW